MTVIAAKTEEDWWKASSPVQLLSFPTTLEETAPLFWLKPELVAWMLSCRSYRDYRDSKDSWPFLLDDNQLLTSLHYWRNCPQHDGRAPDSFTRAALLREIMGNPWQQSPDSEEVQRWCSPQVRALLSEASWIRKVPNYLDPECLLVLSDALEEEGCNWTYLLDHLRGMDPCVACSVGQPGWVKTFCPACKGTGKMAMACAHYNGCWALDFLCGIRRRFPMPSVCPR